MKKVILLILTAVIAGLVQPAAAAENVAEPTASAVRPASLDQRFEECVKNPDCSAQEKSQLIEDIRAALQNDGETPQPEASSSHLHDMMKALEPGNFTKKTGEQLNLVEPAAGVARKSYTNPGQEQIDREKLKWGQSWAPEDVSNPYHKW